MEIAIGAARWVVGRALSPVTDGLLESWAASSELGPNVRALKLELLYAQGMLNNARGRDLSNPALAQLLLELRHLAYNADDVLDELEYFRIQDDLDGTYETTDAADDRGLVVGIILNARHTARAVARKLKFSSCSCAFASRDDRDEEQEDAKQGCLSSYCSCGGRKDRDSTSSPPPPPSNNGDMGVHIGCMAQVISSAHNSARAVGKRLPCYSLPSVHDNAQTKVECIVHAPKLKFDRVEVSRRMAEIIEQLKPLCAKVATILDLEISGSNRTTSQGIDLHRTKTTTPQIIEATLYGRGNHKNNVVDIITHGKDSANNLTVISIVGSGGIGKTTFTQHIYAEVKSHFHVPIWICVSLDFNAKRLAQEIVKQIVKQMPKVQEENKNASDEELIEKGLQSKQFILVLDDMWICHEDEWKKLLAPFKKGGTRGNMIIVTTRIPKVAKMVATRDCLIRLERLKHEDCMHFFQACVFDGQQLWKGHPDLHKVGEDIVKRLKGSPLAVKTVGRLLRNQLTLNHWRKVLESKEWELQKNDDDIMPALKLSFNYLPFDLQQCFSYCALFPEDYEFDSKELIHLWIGLGLLDTRDQNKRTEDIGEDYLNDLVDYGFFQKNFEEDSHPYYLIHDLLHELADVKR
ncbi:putative disease resistance protein RGA4 isoform X2 [Phragmites australis]|uniref:putative disease resistance protein RGA4 isoform X2 n=1 Tax=Phragmites australis TaxID=29695 RepID=UPI002D77EBF4|nr:putative disease resistance protein RGA4 isoform X2 [Phragmites australis]